MDEFFAKYEVSLNIGHAIDILEEKLKCIKKRHQKGKDVEEMIKEYHIMLGDLVNEM